MPLELRWALAAALALAVGVACAEPYARLAAPFYAAVDRLISAKHPWEVTSVEVRPGKSAAAELQLHGYVRRHPDDLRRAARVVGRVQVGEVVETPLVFWTLLLVWPAASIRQRAERLIIGAPVFVALEAMTTASQLMLPMAQASAILAGDNDPTTAWDHWSRFLEAGGQFALVCVGAIIVISAARRIRPSASAGNLRYRFANLPANLRPDALESLPDHVAWTEPAARVPRRAENRDYRPPHGAG